jgi:ABC-type bacteriocin/lantibiotic exporter with double-glycine peptidase domain
LINLKHNSISAVCNSITIIYAFINTKALKEQLTPLQRFFRMLSLDKREIIMIYTYALFNGLINLSLPLGVQAIIGFVISAEFSASWGLLIFIVVAGVIIAGVIQILQLSLTELLQKRVFTRAAFEFAYRIPRFKIEKISGLYAPELINRFFDTLMIQKGLSKILMDFSTSSLQILFGLLLLSLYHPFFVFFGIVLVGLFTLIFFLSGPKGLKTSLLESKYKYEVAHWLEELGRSMGTFKLAGNANLSLQKTNQLVGNYLKFRKDHFKVLIFQFSNIVAFKTLITAGLLILGSILVINQEINLGQFVASEIIILLVLNSVEKLILSMETIYDVLTGMEKLGQVTDIPIEEDKGLHMNDLNLGKGIQLQLSNLSYRYPQSGFDALSKVNLSIEAGEKVCISGPHQSGKSTLVSLLSGLFLQYEGSIQVNGVPLRDIDLMSYRTVVGDNLSIQYLFSGTLSENITVGRDIPAEDILGSIDKVGLSYFLKQSPNGLNTLIKPEGLGLSTSEKIKIILARIFSQRPKLIVLDQVLDHLEAVDRSRIINELMSPGHGWTVLMVSNDPELMRKCDQVVAMEAGEIIEVKYKNKEIQNAQITV